MEIRKEQLDLDIMESSFLAMYKSLNEVYARFEHRWEDNGIIKGVSVIGDARLGVINLKDKEVLKAIIRLYLSVKGESICTQKPTYEDLTITVKSLTVIALEMGYAPSNINGRLRNDIRDSLQKLISCSLYPYPTNDDFRILDRFEKDGNRYDITISQGLYDIIFKYQHNFLIDNRALQINSLVARNIYEYGYQIKNKDNVATIKIESLMNRFPVVKYDKYAKKYMIMRELDKLNKYEFVDVSLHGKDVEITYR